MKFFIVIPTLNEEKYLENCLKSIFKQIYQNFVIIVSDYKSSDKTLDIAKQYSCEIVNCEEKGVGYACWLAGEYIKNNLKFSEKDVILRTSADCILREDALLNVLDTFNFNKNAKLVYCIANLYDADIYHKILFSILEGLRSKLNVSGEFQAININAYYDVGGYDKNLAIGEDWDMAKKIAFKYGFNSIVRINKILVLESARRFKNKLALWGGCYKDYNTFIKTSVR
ncbi:MAG: glycosyltransferase family A protein [Nitrososphaerota archaeon]